MGGGMIRCVKSGELARSEEFRTWMMKDNDFIVEPPGEYIVERKFCRHSEGPAVRRYTGSHLLVHSSGPRSLHPQHAGTCLQGHDPSKGLVWQVARHN